MNVGRLCSIEGAAETGTHQRASEYLKLVCGRYPGMGFSTQLEWLGEQMLVALRLLLDDTRCSEEERAAIDRFLALAGEEIPGPV